MAEPAGPILTSAARLGTRARLDTRSALTGSRFGLAGVFPSCNVRWPIVHDGRSDRCAGRRPGTRRRSADGDERSGATPTNAFLGTSSRTSWGLAVTSARTVAGGVVAPSHQIFDRTAIPLVGGGESPHSTHRQQMHQQQVVFPSREGPLRAAQPGPLSVTPRPSWLAASAPIRASAATRAPPRAA